MDTVIHVTHLPSDSNAAGQWEISASPDLLRRLKRIFYQVRRASKKSFVIQHTPAVARDLEMCRTRWDFEMSPEDQEFLESESRNHDDTQRTISEVMSGRALDVTPDIDYALELADHQIQARDAALVVGGVLVGDELGAGKTFSGLSVLAWGKNRPALAVTIGGSVPAQWEREAQRLYPGLKVHIIRQMAEYDFTDDGMPDLIICTYSKLAEWGPRLAGQVNTVIFDEVQELRRSGTHKYYGAHLVANAAQIRIVLSSTPIWNRLDESYNIFNILNPDVLGGRSEFLREWSDSIHDPTELRSYLTNSGVYMRRTGVVPLPPPIVEEIAVPSDEEYIATAETSAVEIARLILDKANHRASFTARGQLDMWMRQATGISKARPVAYFVASLLEKRESVLLFAFHRGVYEIWMEVFDELGITYALYTGSETPAAKQRSIAAFESGEAQVLIMSLRASAALDGLQRVSHTLVFGELDWAPGIHAQGVGRLQRPGQTQRVEVFWCVTDSGSDPIILDVHAQKLAETEAFIKDAGELERVSSIKDTGALELMAREILARSAPDVLREIESQPEVDLNVLR